MQNPPVRHDATTVRAYRPTQPDHSAVKDKLVRKATRFGLMFVYLWLVFGRRSARAPVTFSR
jgi:hypothetical protein